MRKCCWKNSSKHCGIFATQNAKLMPGCRVRRTAAVEWFCTCVDVRRTSLLCTASYVRGERRKKSYRTRSWRGAAVAEGAPADNAEAVNTLPSRGGHGRGFPGGRGAYGCGPGPHLVLWTTRRHGSWHGAVAPWNSRGEIFLLVVAGPGAARGCMTGGQRGV